MTTHVKKRLTPADVAQALEEFGPAEWDEVRALLWEKKTLKEPSAFWSLVGQESLPEEPPPTPGRRPHGAGSTKTNTREAPHH